MIHYIGTTEGQVDHEKNLHGGMHDPPDPGHHHQELAEPLSHDGRVVQRLADGHIAVIHHDNEDDLSFLQESVPKKAESDSHPRRWLSMVILGVVTEVKEASMKAK